MHPATNRIDAIFASARSRSQRVLMPFVVGQHPAPGSTGALLRALDRGGASIVEIGLAFSDPIADGPVIAQAMHHALQAGASPAGLLEEVASARSSTGLGLVAMVSVSIVHRMGGARGFVKRAAEAGIDGLIVPDAPLEEMGPTLDAARDAGLCVSMLVAPSTDDRRAEVIVRRCTGFVYLLARAGITGERSDVPDIGPRISRLRSTTDLPIACGFGIGSAEQVRAVVEHADAAIVGSALVRRIEAAHTGGRPVADEVEACVRELAGGLSRPRA